MRNKSVFRFLSLVLVLSFTTAVTAQNNEANIFVGGNVIVGFPSGDFSNAYTYATGIDASMGAEIVKKTYLIGTLGYVSYKAKDLNPFGKIRLVPIKAGVRVYPYKEFYIAANAGVGFLKDEVMSSGESRFVYDAGFGIHFSMIQVGFAYDGWKRKNNSGTTNTLQIKLGIALK